MINAQNVLSFSIAWFFTNCITLLFMMLDLELETFAPLLRSLYIMLKRLIRQSSVANKFSEY